MPATPPTDGPKVLAGNFLSAIVLVVCLYLTAIADDPLNAFPTFEDTVEDKVRRLTDDELDTIRAPENGDQILFSVAREKSVGVKKDTRQLVQYFQVYADGRIVCNSNVSFDSSLEVETAEDSLSRPEFLWLLHLAINECELLDLSTAKVDARFQAIKQRPPRGQQKRFHYSVAMNSNENKVAIPEEALVVRPLRRELKLGPLASLNKYIAYLIHRAYLGDPKEREVLLDRLNAKLQIEHPRIPAFRMEHLSSGIVFSNAPTNFSGRLVATFEQEIEKEMNQFRRFNGRIVKKNAEAEPAVTIWVNEYEKR